MNRKSIIPLLICAVLIVFAAWQLLNAQTASRPSMTSQRNVGVYVITNSQGLGWSVASTEYAAPRFVITSKAAKHLVGKDFQHWITITDILPDGSLAVTIDGKEFITKPKD